VYILGYLLSCIVITVMKAFYVGKQIGSPQYSLRNSVLFSIAWLAWTLPGIQTVCYEIGCRYSMKFTWFASWLYQFPPFDRVSPTAMITLAGVGYAVLTIYFLGHCLGWMFYGVRKALRIRAE